MRCATKASGQLGRAVASRRKSSAISPQRYRFAAVHMPHPKAVIGGEPFRGVFLLARQFADAGKRGTGFRRLIPLGPDQRVAKADLEVKAPLAQRGGALHRI